MMIYFHVIDIRSYAVKVFYVGFPFVQYVTCTFERVFINSQGLPGCLNKLLTYLLIALTKMGQSFQLYRERILPNPREIDQTFTICSNCHPLPSTSSPKADLHQDRCISIELDRVLEKDGLKAVPLLFNMGPLKSKLEEFLELVLLVLIMWVLGL